MAAAGGRRGRLTAPPRRAHNRTVVRISNNRSKTSAGRGRRAAARRAEILAAASRVFRTMGFAAAGMRDIADRRRPLARQPLSLLQRQGRDPLRLPEPDARSPAGRRRRRGAIEGAGRRAAARAGGRSRPLHRRPDPGIGRALRARRAPGPAAGGRRREARPLRARRPGAGRRGHPARRAGARPTRRWRPAPSSAR